MAKRQKTYTADELKAIKGRLDEQKGVLVSRMAQQLAKLATFDDACLVRDDAQRLVTTLMALGNIDQSIWLAERGTAQMLAFKLEACGLDG